MSTANSDSIYERVVQHIFFAGGVSPGSKVVERKLADELGVSRIPIRETLRQLAGQGLLVADHHGQGVRLRKYTAEDIRQLYELRELLDGGAARLQRAATDTDVMRLETVCQQMAVEIGDYGSKKWADLDHAFHDAMADASHNDRIARSLKQLLTECHYIFYLYPSHYGRPKPSREEAKAHMQGVYEDHRTLLKLVCGGDADGGAESSRGHAR